MKVIPDKEGNMFFSRKKSMTEREVVTVALTAATVFLIVERKSPITSAAHAQKRVDEAIDAVINAHYDTRPSEKDMRFIVLGTSALVDDGGRKFVETRIERFIGGVKGVFPEEVDIAHMIVNKRLNEVFASDK